MSETIYDFGASSRTLPQAIGVPRGRASVAAPAKSTELRVGLISNPKSHRNRIARSGGDRLGAAVTSAVPKTRDELRQAMIGFAKQGIDLLIINGGDGTVRDVLTCAGTLWSDEWPLLAILPSGKTNALAIDLGVPSDWTVEQVMAAARGGATIGRAPIEVERRDLDTPVLRGFLLGAGAFLRGTELAQKTHRAGAFRGLAVGLALGWAMSQTLFGSSSGPWRRGDAMRLAYAADTLFMHGRAPSFDGERYIFFASTLDRLPIGLRPFGRIRHGLKTLVIDAPPRWLAATMAFIFAGSEARWLSKAGYHRADTMAVEVSLRSSFILDGEMFAAGDYMVRQGPTLRFVIP